MLQVSVRRWLDFGLVADRFHSFSICTSLRYLRSSLRHPSGSSQRSLLPGLFLIGCLTLLSGCGSIAGGPTQVTSKTATGQLSGLSCTNTSVTGSGTDTCTVTLNAAAGSSGMSVNLSSSSTAVTVPASVTIPAGATSATLSATAGAVATAQTVTLTASANGANASTSLQLTPEPSGAVLTTDATSVAFGDVALNTSSTQSVTLAALGTQPVTVSSIAITGTGFTVASVQQPMTLNPGQTAILNVSFLPTALGAETGQLTIASNATNANTVVIALSGSGGSTATAYQVDLTWNAPADSADPVVGYNVYRSTAGGTFRLLNALVNPQTSFVDNNVQNGVSYAYYVTSVDSTANESSPSNTWSATTP